MCVFRPNREIDSSFLLYTLNSPIVREQATHVAVGAAHPHINIGDIKSYSIPLPSLDEQTQITKKFDSLAAETQCLVRIYEQKLAVLEVLKKSLLHRAFSGEL
jgi:type I restriction enzyme S subunit